MRIVSRARLRNFWERVPDSEQALRAWYSDVSKASWQHPAEVKAQYGSASILANSRVVFNIKGNAFRVVALVLYRPQHVLIRFVGTHAEYDRIDAETI